MTQGDFTRQKATQTIKSCRVCTSFTVHMCHLPPIQRSTFCVRTKQTHHRNAYSFEFHRFVRREDVYLSGRLRLLFASLWETAKTNRTHFSKNQERNFALLIFDTKTIIV